VALSLLRHEINSIIVLLLGELSTDSVNDVVPVGMTRRYTLQKGVKYVDG
jgi:hypothetical protein